MYEFTAHALRRMKERGISKEDIDNCNRFMAGLKDGAIMMLPQIEYDKKANAVYIRFASKPCSYTKKIDNLRYIDYASDNTPIGVELLNVNTGVVIDSLPNANEVSRLLSGKSIKVFA